MSSARTEAPAAPRVGAFGGAVVAVSLLLGCGGRATASSSQDAGVSNDACASGACNPDGNADGSPDGGTACMSGASCSPAGNPCQLGTLSCSSGSSACTPVGNAPDGTACGTGQICSNGTCTACMDGAACSPAGNPCQTGTISCSTGQATCTATGDVPDATSCSAGMCCGGLCAACSTPPNATATCSATTCGFTCTTGFTLCAGSCVDASSDNQACGPSCTKCPTGSSCKSSACSPVFKYGLSTAFSPCVMTGNQSAYTGYLLGERVDIAAAIQVTALGVIATSAEPATGVDGIMALYDDVGGVPSALQAQTASTTIGPGDNLIPVESPASVAAGTYWIMAEYDATASVCVDASDSNPIAYVSIGGYEIVPATLANQQGVSSVDLNYYVVGQ